MIVPINKKVLIKVLAKETKTESGIYIPEVKGEKNNKAEVVAVADGLDTSLKAGDTVIFDIYAGIEIEENSITYKLVNIDDVIAKIN